MICSRMEWLKCHLTSLRPEQMTWTALTNTLSHALAAARKPPRIVRARREHSHTSNFTRAPSDVAVADPVGRACIQASSIGYAS